MVLSRSWRNARARTLAFAAVVMIALALPGAALAKKAAATPPAPPTPVPGVLTVQTQNMYPGADLTPAVAAPSQAAFFQAANLIWDQVKRSSPSLRIDAIASGINARRPDIV